jgi:hypothetical protein
VGPGVAGRSQEEPGGARRNQKEPGVARGCQEQPGAPWGSSFNLLAFLGFQTVWDGWPNLIVLEGGGSWVQEGL